MPINIGLVEDQQLFREGMKAILSTDPDFKIIFESVDGHSVVGKLKECKVLPDVLLVDFSLPPFEGKEFNGTNVTTAVRSTFPEIKILILSVHNSEHFIAQVIEQGAHGYLVKDSDPQEVFDAIHSVHKKGSYINEMALRAIQNNMYKSRPAANPDQSGLSKREIEILAMICQQLTAEEIAEKLFISVKTVNGHRANLLQKTGSKNTAGLVIHALKNNLVRLS